jgi:hypothetical protein
MNAGLCARMQLTRETCKTDEAEASLVHRRNRYRQLSNLCGGAVQWFERMANSCLDGDLQRKHMILHKGYEVAWTSKRTG